MLERRGIFVNTKKKRAELLMWKNTRNKWNLENFILFFSIQPQLIHTHTCELSAFYHERKLFPRKMLFYFEKKNCSVPKQTFPISARESVFLVESLLVIVCVEAMIFRLRDREKVLCAFSAFSSSVCDGWCMCMVAFSVSLVAVYWKSRKSKKKGREKKKRIKLHHVMCFSVKVTLRLLWIKLTDI